MVKYIIFGCMVILLITVLLVWFAIKETIATINKIDALEEKLNKEQINY